MSHKLKSLLIGALTVGSQAFGATLTLDLNGLEPMRGQHYEGWNIVDGQALTTGRFSVSKKGQVYAVDASGARIANVGPTNAAQFDVSDDQRRSRLFVLTIEPNGDTDDGPSPIHIIGGNYANGSAALTIDHPSSIGTDFQNASGSFFLAAPTGGDFNQGLWFFDGAQGQGSLNLPELPTAWVYEGWIVNTQNGKKFSTGLFRSGQGVDSDGAGILAGPLKLSFPPSPGQDIVKSSVVLDDGIHRAVITVEPYPDFDPKPYALKILKKDIPLSTQGMTPLDLQSIAGVPSGTAKIQ